MMTSIGSGTVNRRLAIGAAGAVAAGWALPGQLRARVVTQRGMIGGGALQLEQGQVDFSVFASRLTFDEGNDIILGSIRWVDAGGGVTLASTRITEYDVLESGEGELRQIRGTMSANGEGEHPFIMDVLDLGAPGAGVDTVTLNVGASAVAAGATPTADTTGFGYTATGALAAGDLQDVDISGDIDAGEVVPATPES